MSALRVKEIFRTRRTSLPEEVFREGWKQPGVLLGSDDNLKRDDHSGDYQPLPEHKFSFGLWTVANRGRNRFGDAVRSALSPNEIVALLAEVGAWGVNCHDNDLVPIDATAQELDKIVRDFRQALEQYGIVVPMATVNLFFDPVFRDGAFTADDADVRSYALKKRKRAMDLGAQFGAKIFVLWGGREGTEQTPAAGRRKRSNTFVGLLMHCANIMSHRNTGINLRWKQSQTSRGPTYTFRSRLRIWR